MKYLLSVLMVSNCFAYDLSSKNPDQEDISIRTLVDYSCSKSGFFNPIVCVEGINKCYNKYQWPKTVDKNLKIEVFNQCAAKVIR